MTDSLHSCFVCKMGIFRVGDVVDLVRHYFNAYGLLTFVAPVPREYMGRYQRHLAVEPSVSHHPPFSQSRSMSLSQLVHGGVGPSSHRPPITPRSRSRVASETASEGVGETEAKRPQTTDQPPPHS